MIIYIDMDDTLFDFSSAHRKGTEQWPQSKYGFFLNLKPIEGAIEAVASLQEMGHEVCIATRPSIYNPLSYTEKRVCIENHFGREFCEGLNLTPNKARLIGDILIDDRIDEGDKTGNQLGFTGELFQFAGINKYTEREKDDLENFREVRDLPPVTFHSSWEKIVEYIIDNY